MLVEERLEASVAHIVRYEFQNGGARQYLVLPVAHYTTLLVGVLLEVVENDGVGLPLLVILMGVLFQIISIGPLLIERCACELEGAVLHFDVTFLAWYEGKTDAGRADLAIRKYGCEVTNEWFVQMGLKCRALVDNVNFSEELTC